MTRGYQVAQSVHGLAEFAIRYPLLFKEWCNQTIVCLSIENEERLANLLQKLAMKKYPVVGFYEPGLDGQLTSVASYGCDKLVSNLKLTGK